MSCRFSDSPPVELRSCGTQAVASSHSPCCRHLLKYSNRSRREVTDSVPKGCMSTVTATLLCSVVTTWEALLLPYSQVRLSFLHLKYEGKDVRVHSLANKGNVHKPIKCVTSLEYDCSITPFIKLFWVHTGVEAIDLHFPVPNSMALVFEIPLAALYSYTSFVKHAYTQIYLIFPHFKKHLGYIQVTIYFLSYAWVLQL